LRVLFFCFSSRTRHTICYRDWSSDVCSSDLDGVEVETRFKPPEVEVHTYLFLLRPREIEHQQFPWTFQKQLYDCLHDYIIEMFKIGRASCRERVEVTIDTLT